MTCKPDVPTRWHRFRTIRLDMCSTFSGRNLFPRAEITFFFKISKWKFPLKKFFTKPMQLRKDANSVKQVKNPASFTQSEANFRQLQLIFPEYETKYFLV